MMRRSPLKPSAKPMSRGTRTLARSPMKTRSRPRRPEGYRDTAALESVRGERCYLAVPFVCLGEAGRATVVACHSNSSKHGKGAGLKAKDEFTVPGCRACHAWLDTGTASRETKFEVFELALSAWAPARALKLALKERK